MYVADTNWRDLAHHSLVVLVGYLDTELSPEPTKRKTILPLMNNASQLQESCQCDSVRCKHRIGAARHDVAQVLLRASLQDLNDSRNRFIPLNQLRSEFDFDAIQGLVHTFFGDETHDVSSVEIADQISPRAGACRCCKSNDLCTGRRIIFISLILLAKENLILHFIKSVSPVCDSTLPLKPTKTQEPKLETDSDQPERRFVEIEGLGPQEKDLFYHLQWQMRAPYFTGRPPSSDDLWRLDEEVSLPWTEVSDIEVHQDDEIPIDLNFSTVHKIRIHEDHHNLDGSEDGFALKILDPITLPESAEDSFKNERTSRILHPHITALLTAFEHRTKFHLLLPFAEGGNLQKLWKKHPESPKSSGGRIAWYSDQWLIEQCYGIADALTKVHGHPSLLDPDGKFQKPKLHQDIKPENILCFKKEPGYSLKLTDFGFSRELGPGQTFPTTKAIGCLTYRPPEADIKDSETDHSWDIWCLGCVFLELVTWVIQGESGVKAFGDKRLSEEKGRDQEDTFFRGKPRGILKCFFTTKIKQSVTSHIRDLRTNQECTEELRAFLRCIEENMLVVKSNQRATSPQVRDSLKDLVDQLAGTTGTHQQQHHQSEIAPLLGGQSETTGAGVGKYT